MFRNVLSMILFGGLIGGGLIGCGEDAPPAGGRKVAGAGEDVVAEGEGQGEGEGEGSPNEGEGEGPVAGEGEGEGPLPPGADGEPCGGASRNECSDGYECLTCGEANVESVPDDEFPGETKQCEGRICTCPQWFAGAWWAEFTNVHVVDYVYDFTASGIDAAFWSQQEIDIQQEGCTLIGAHGNFPFVTGDLGEGKVEPQPDGFFWKRGVGTRDGDAWITFTGQLAPDHRTVTGTCEGTYPDRSTRPDTFFKVECGFTLTRR